MSSTLKRSVPFESALPAKMPSLVQSEDGTEGESLGVRPSTCDTKVSLHLLYVNPSSV